MKQVTIYTDGSWKKRQQAGGWACLLSYNDDWKLIASGEGSTTISRVELTAVLVGLQQLTEPCNVTIYSDSMYCVNCINSWIKRWSVEGWITKSGKAVAHQDLLIPIRNMMNYHSVNAKWIKSHTNNTGIHYQGNAIADVFAQYGSDGIL